MIHILRYRINIGSDPLVCLMRLGTIAVKHCLNLLDAERVFRGEGLTGNPRPREDPHEADNGDKI